MTWPLHLSGPRLRSHLLTALHPHSMTNWIQTREILGISFHLPRQITPRAIIVERKKERTLEETRVIGCGHA